MARPESAPKTPLAERLRTFRRELGDLDRDAIAARIGVSKSAFASYERGDSEPTASALDAYRREFNLNVRWLLTGDGSMHDEEKAAAPLPVLIAPDFAEQIKTAMEHMTKVAQNLAQSQSRDLVVEHYVPKTVKYYPTIYASAGGGAAALVESPGYDLDVEGLARVLFGIEQRDLFFLPVRGDSMLPTFAHGDVAVIERWRGVGEIEDNRIYVVSLEGDVYVKRATWGDEGLNWVSDNDLPQYAPIIVPPDRIDDMNVLGEVLWRLQPIRKKKA